MDCSIQTSADQCLFAAPRGFSQLITSFIGSWCQGIRPAPFVAWPLCLFSNCSFCSFSESYDFQKNKSLSHWFFCVLLLVSILLILAMSDYFLLATPFQCVASFCLRAFGCISMSFHQFFTKLLVLKSPSAINFPLCTLFTMWQKFEHVVPSFP